MLIIMQHWTRYYNLKKECQHECRFAYNKYVSDMVDPSKNTVAKRLCSYIKSKRQDNNGGAGPLILQDKTFTDPLAKSLQITFHLYLQMKTLPISQL